jgi:hypothetical protein
MKVAAAVALASAVGALFALAPRRPRPVPETVTETVTATVPSIPAGG